MLRIRRMRRDQNHCREKKIDFLSEHRGQLWHFGFLDDLELLEDLRQKLAEFCPKHHRAFVLKSNCPASSSHFCVVDGLKSEQKIRKQIFRLQG